MNRKTIIYLIAHIIGCLSGMFTAILGFAEMFGATLTNIGQIPFHIALAMFFSGIFTFITLFMNGLDHETWEKLK
jgi:hypothetical protein